MQLSASLSVLCSLMVYAGTACLGIGFTSSARAQGDGPGQIVSDPAFHLSLA